jgi:release factor glutamine methyltransferase
MLVKETLAQATIGLQNQGVESPRLDAELLLAYVLGVNRAAILTWPDRRLTPKQLTHFRELTARRAAREPLAYLLGRREFFGLEFVVSPAVLIPRPETELLVEHALRLAGRFTKPPYVADVGAGSGAIAVTLAVRLPAATVYALDASTEALAVVAENAGRHHVSERVHCVQSDLLTALPKPVDLITANLPYVTSEEWQGLMPEIRLYEPRAALDGGPDGLALIRRLLATAAPHLNPGGAILIEIGASQGAAGTTLARELFPQAAVQLFPDYASLDRLVVVRLPAKGNPQA